MTQKIQVEQKRQTRIHLDNVETGRHAQVGEGAAGEGVEQDVRLHD